MCYYGNVILHLQQYSHRLNLFLIQNIILQYNICIPILAYVFLNPSTWIDQSIHSFIYSFILGLLNAEFNYNNYTAPNARLAVNTELQIVRLGRSCPFVTYHFRICLARPRRIANNIC